MNVWDLDRLACLLWLYLPAMAGSLFPQEERTSVGMEGRQIYVRRVGTHTQRVSTVVGGGGRQKRTEGRTIKRMVVAVAVVTRAFRFQRGRYSVWQEGGGGSLPKPCLRFSQV